ncbi:hypothetical protein OJ254_04485 [Streptomyces endophytica]|uniref:DUF7683 domain-containing protein n=2 Tax=Streptomyces endophytica TaxID=2991496 RepID=A0ABY6P7Q3_9ACTN|nr:hypothetical protein [Streptomyces endophytica]UZJ29835.1 hypothetical protein OJ254_04485 [Streptomyces endophytica]
MMMANRKIYAFSKEDESFVNEIQVPDVSPQILADVFQVNVENVDYVHDIGPAQALFLERLTGKSLDLARFDYQLTTLGDDDPEAG